MKHLIALALTAALSVLASNSQAGVLLFDGDLEHDNDMDMFAYAVERDANVRFRSFSYAGGRRGDGSTDLGGGFDILVSVFDALGGFVASVDDGASRVDPLTGEALDVAFALDLAAGDYKIVITQFPGFALGDLSDGFADVNTSVFGCSNGVFCDLSGANRSSRWSLDIAVPAPSIPLLLGLGFAAFGAAGLFKQRYTR